MSPEQDPSAEELYKEHRKEARSLDVWSEEDRLALEDLGQAQADRKDVLTDKYGSEELDRRNAEAEVQEQAHRVADAQANINASQKRYKANIIAGADNAGRFVDEATTEDAERSAENEPKES